MNLGPKCTEIFISATGGRRVMLRGMLSLCQYGYEALLERELGEAGLTVTEKGPGWALSAEGELPELAFPQLTLLAPPEIKGESANALAQHLADNCFESPRGERTEAPWPCIPSRGPGGVQL